MKIIIFEDESVPYVVVDMLDLSKKYRPLTDLENGYTLKDNLYREAYLFKIPKIDLISGVKNPTNKMLCDVLYGCEDVLSLPYFKKLFKNINGIYENNLNKKLTPRQELEKRIFVRRLENIYNSRIIEDIVLPEGNSYSIDKEINDYICETFKICVINKGKKAIKNLKNFFQEKTISITIQFYEQKVLEKEKSIKEFDCER